MIDRLKAEFSWWWYEENGRLWVFPIGLFACVVLMAAVVAIFGDKGRYAIGLMMGVVILIGSLFFIYKWIKDGTRF